MKTLDFILNGECHIIKGAERYSSFDGNKRGLRRR